MNEIGDKGAMYISESLKTNTTLTKLYLGGDDKLRKVTIMESMNKMNEWMKCDFNTIYQ